MRPARARPLAAAVVRQLDELFERALEALEIEVQVEDLVDADRLRFHDRGFGRSVLMRHRLDLVHRAARDREHDDERHLALRARDLQMESLILVAENLDVAAFQAAPADRTVVIAGSVADELDDAHRSDPYYARRLRRKSPSGGLRCRCNRTRRRSPNGLFPRA